MIRVSLLRSEWPADLDSVKQARKHLTAALRLSAVPLQRQHETVLAFSELATNLVLHSVPRAHSFELDLLRDSGRWQLVIADDGGTLEDWASLLSTGLARLANEEFADLSESGRGLGLVAGSFPDAQYAHDPITGRNSWVLNLGVFPVQSTERIVLVDDDKASLELVATYLGSDYHVDTYSDPGAALRAIRELPPDLVIADLRMPYIDGLELRRRLTQDERTELVPFVFLTAEHDDAVRDKADLEGIDDYLVKPARRRTLLSVARRTVRRSKGLRARLGRRIESEITQSLELDVVTAVEGWTFETRSFTAGPGGGDFLRNIQVGSDLLLVLADVMGHGVAAKFFAHAHAGYLGGLLDACNNSHRPADILNSLSRRAESDDLADGSLLTCLVARLCENGRVQLSSAGHPAPLLIDRSGLRSLDVGGPLPGLFSEAAYRCEEVKLEEGDVMLLYTDGLFDGSTEPAHRERLQERLLDVIASGYGRALPDLADSIANAFLSEVGNAPADDATFVLMQPR